MDITIEELKKLHLETLERIYWSLQIKPSTTLEVVIKALAKARG